MQVKIIVLYNSKNYFLIINIIIHLTINFINAIIFFGDFMTTIIIAILTCLTMILSILLFPKIKIKNISLDSYWIIVLLGALILIICNLVDLKTIINVFTSDSNVNPIKILVLFISMTILSIYLDEVGLFRFLAHYATKKAGNKQIKLFLYLYILVSILTIFTSNDIIILTFTPFICYFAKNTKINPLPYLIAEFVGANTWSMMFLIGNPTNIYIGTFFNINFIEYLQVMFLPTLCGGLCSFLIIYLLFKKDLNKSLMITDSNTISLNKPLLTIGLIHLIACSILLVISSYINLEMWIITFCFAISLIICISIYKLFNKNKDIYLIKTIKRIPYQLIPFVISMFIIVLSLKEANVTNYINSILNNNFMLYGLSSFISSNILNNIPMSVFFSEILDGINIKNIYACIISSNIGAILTPIGALAGIMWMSLLKQYNVNYSFKQFTKYGIIISIPTLIITLFVLYFI